MTEIIYDVPAAWSKKAWASDAKYKKLYAARSRTRTPSGASRASGSTGSSLQQGAQRQLQAGKVSIKWYEDGTTNVAYNCIDRHLATRAKQTAIIWEGDDPSESKKISYGQLYTEVCKFANVLKAQGVKKGDRVTIYLR